MGTTIRKQTPQIVGKFSVENRTCLSALLLTRRYSERNQAAGFSAPNYHEESTQTKDGRKSEIAVLTNDDSKQVTRHARRWKTRGPCDQRIAFDYNPTGTKNTILPTFSCQRKKRSIRHLATASLFYFAINDRRRFLRPRNFQYWKLAVIVQSVSELDPRFFVIHCSV